MRTVLTSLLIFSLATFSSGQILKGMLIDSTSGLPVADAFVFYANTSTGTTSTDDGIFELPNQTGLEVFLVVSHLNYQTRTLNLSVEKPSTDTVFLSPNDLLLTEIVVGQKADPRLRRKRENAFKKAFIGSDRNKITLINLEVLLFWEDNDTLFTMSDEPLVINNDLLGYKITYFLEDFQLHPNGDVQFEGSAFFEEMDGGRKELAQFKRNRLRAYENSPQYLFSQLVSCQLDSSIYKIGFSRRLADQSFEMYELFSPSIMIKDSINKTSTILCKSFFTVIDKSVRVSNTMQKTKLPTASFGEIKKTPILYETSYLYSKTNRIILDEDGVILNQKDMEEYGYWATIRTSALLPYDYKVSSRR